MDTATRLKAIEARCEALGWKVDHRPEYYEFMMWADGFEISIMLKPTGLQAAERLLACYEPGPVAFTSARSYHPDTGEVNGTMLFCKDKELAGGRFKLIPVEDSDGL